MNLEVIGSNQTVLHFTDRSVLFSYNTPVAIRYADGTELKTDQKYSATTTRHINKWLNSKTVESVPQDYIENQVSRYIK